MDIKRLRKAALCGLAFIPFFFLMSIPTYLLNCPYNIITTYALVFILFTYGIYKHG